MKLVESLIAKLQFNLQTTPWVGTMEFEIPNTCTFVANNNTDTGHVWTVRFFGGERCTVTATTNPNKTVTYRILEIFDFFSTTKEEIEGMVANFAAEGNWEQEK